MNSNIEVNKKAPLCTALLAHVDAGKTTLSEAMLFCTGRLRSLGRVDHRSSFLDNTILERERGITIFSKQAMLELPHTTVTLLDTPGHVDFSTETERTMQVLDCAVLVVSGTDGVQAHTETLWAQLKSYRVPTFVFVTKMDLPHSDKERALRSLERLSDGFVDFSLPEEERAEQIALCSEEAMERYLAGTLDEECRSELIAQRKLFPVLFGSGLRTDGVEELLEQLDAFSPPRQWKDGFAARVFKLARDAQGNRLTYLKLTGGSLGVRDSVAYTAEDGTKKEEKISQIRIYSGLKYETADRVYPGQICAVTGLSASYVLQGLGKEGARARFLTEPVLRYGIVLPKGTDERTVLPKLRELAEEDPQLHLVWNAEHRQIELQLMGKVQAEVFCALVRERFDLELSLTAGRILYRETVENTVEGVGHFEPLRHYAEVHLTIEPGEAGSGILLDTTCPEDELDRNWQRLILTHLQEKQHLGVLTGSPLTDVCITLRAGRAHLKHTEGGDFREATYRAVRQGLMQAKSVLLEPYYEFTLDVPTGETGRAISDVRTMSGTLRDTAERDGMTRLTGTAPVSEMNGYLTQVLAYTHGRGRLALRVGGYQPCHDAEKVIAELGYEPERDVKNTADSVFCAHGAGVNIRWNEVAQYMHLPSCLAEKKEAPAVTAHRMRSIDERELEAIMEREFGPIRRREYGAAQRVEAPSRTVTVQKKKEYLIVDGYNVIFAWDELKRLAAERLDLARGALMDMLSSCCGFTKSELVLVFDGFRTPGNPGERTRYHNIHVAYTADGETADAYIEQLAGSIGHNYQVRVVTSDNLIRLSALRSGVLRTSSKEFELEVRDTLQKIDEIVKKSSEGAHTTRLKYGKQ